MGSPNYDVLIHGRYSTYHSKHVLEEIHLCTIKKRLNDDDIGAIKIWLDMYEALTPLQCLTSIMQATNVRYV